MLLFLSYLLALQSYEELVEGIFDRLPAEKEVIAQVTAGVKEACVGHKSFLAPLATKLLGMDMVQRFVWNWWEFLTKTLVDNSTKPPDSLRAIMYTKTRREAREDAIRHFLADDDIRSQASDIPERRVNRDLTCALVQIEFVSEGGGRWVPCFCLRPVVRWEPAYAEVIIAPGVRIRSKLSLQLP